MALDLSNNPEWLAAVAREREIREAAYLGLPAPIAGGAIEVLPLTLRQQIVLVAARNPIAVGGPATEADAGMFLWALHPAYSPTNTVVRTAYKAELETADLPWEQVIADLREWYAEQTLDSPKPVDPRAGVAQAPAVSGPAVYVGQFAEATGWTRAEILDSSVACLNQERRYFRMRLPRHGIQGGALSNAVEKAVIFERRRKRQEEAERAREGAVNG